MISFNNFLFLIFSFFFLKISCLNDIWSFHVGSTPGYYPPGTISSNWTRNMVLCYMDSRSFTNKILAWDKERFKWLLTFRTPKGEFVDQLFDSFLLLGIFWYDKDFWPNHSPEPTNQTDWEQFMDLQFNMGVKSLKEAILEIQNEQQFFQQINVVIMIPYPDSRQSKFGIVNGKELNFTNNQDRILGVQWFIDLVIKTWNENISKPFISSNQSNKSPVNLLGFYWFNEEMSEKTEEMELLQAVTSYVHKYKLKICWIPYFKASGISQWKEAGFDFATLQPNYAFSNSTLERFKEVANISSTLQMGIEMELPLGIRNHNVKNWQQSFLDYASAAYQYRYLWTALKTYYDGNDFTQMATNSNDYPFYEKLYWIVKGTYPYAPPSSL